MSPTFLLDIQLTVLLKLSHPLKFYLRDYHPFAYAVPGNFSYSSRIKRQSKHHISHTLLHGIQFALCCFQSLLLTASQLISFPPVTKTFQFTGLLVLSDLMRSRIRKFSVQRLPPPRRNFSQVVTSFIN